MEPMSFPQIDAVHVASVDDPMSLGCRLVRLVVTWGLTVGVSARTLLDISLGPAVCAGAVASVAFASLHRWTRDVVRRPRTCEAAQEPVPTPPVSRPGRLGLLLAQGVLVATVGVALVIVANARYLAFIVIAWLAGGADSRSDFWFTTALVLLVSCCLRKSLPW